MIKAILFDLDGTVLPMNEEEFTKGYFELLCKKLVSYGYNKDELTSAVWAGTKMMLANDGSKTNEEVFWNCFAQKYGKEKLKDKTLFDEFYLNEFKQSKVFCAENNLAKKVVKLAKLMGYKTILASNPIFPKDGMITKMNFVGLESQDFDYITSYENSHYSKPNPKYFEEILVSNNLNSEEVIFFGNSEKEDLPAEKVGIKTFLVTHENENNKINFKQIIDILEKLK